MELNDAHFELRLAESAADLAATQALRYRVFVEELGAGGQSADHAARREADRFDAHMDHLMLLDHRRAEGDKVVGVYRLMRRDQAAAAGSFYSESEYDLTALIRSGRQVLELGRSCLHAEYRGGTALLRLWQGLAEYVARHKIHLLFGVASFPGQDVGALAAPLSLLHHRHLADPSIRPIARPAQAQAMDLLPEAELDRSIAARAIPPLIKAYLRLGGKVGQGAWIDRDFNCIDVCLVLDTGALSDRHRAIYNPSAAPPW